MLWAAPVALRLHHGIGSSTSLHATRRSVPVCTVQSDAIVDASIAALRPTFAEIDQQIEARLKRVLDTFQKHRVGPHHFAGVNGYGHGDLGREVLDSIYAELMGAEAAIVRVQCFSGTHAIACALFGVLRPGQEMLTVSGAPYDTLEEVIGLRGRTADGLRGTLADFGVTYRQVELLQDGRFDLDAIDAAIGPSTRMVHVQRSCGYAWRPSIPVAEIGRLATWLSSRHPSVCLSFHTRAPVLKMCDTRSRSKLLAHTASARPLRGQLLR